MTDLTPLQTLGIFAGIPITAFLVIALLVVAPSWARDARYRPGQPWTGDPVWFEGPRSTPGEAQEIEERTPSAEPQHGGGGASASW